MEGDFLHLAMAGVAALAVYCIGRIDGFWKGVESERHQQREKGLPR